MHKVVSKEYSIPNIYENFGGGELSPGKIEFGVVIVRGFFVVRASIPGLYTRNVFVIFGSSNAQYFI